MAFGIARGMAAALIVVLPGCRPGGGVYSTMGTPLADAAIPAHGEASCATGFEAHASGAGCLEIAPPGPCPSGTASFLGERTCVSVGVGACPPDFEATPSGWGCRAILPEVRCGSGTTEVLGSRTCAPVDDCTRPFPPPEATAFIDISFGDAQLDARHFRSVRDAVAAAKTGDVLAIAPGRYVEDVDVVRPLALVGKCAAEVVLENPGDQRAGILVVGARGVDVRGVTLKGHAGGLVVGDGGDATLTSSIVADAREMGVFATGIGSHVRLVRSRVERVTSPVYGWGVGLQDGAAGDVESSVISEATHYGIGVTNAGSTLRLVRSAVLDTKVAPDGKEGSGVAVKDGASVRIERSLVARSQAASVYVAGAGASASIDGSELRGNGAARGLDVAANARVVLTDTSLLAHAKDGVLVRGGGSEVVIRRSVVHGDAPGEVVPGRGVFVAGAAVADIEGMAIVGVSEVGLMVQDDGSRARAARVLVKDTRSVGPATPGGLAHRPGIGAQVTFGGVLTLDHASIDGTGGVGIVVSRAGPAGGAARAIVTDTLVRRTRADGADRLGHGVQVTYGAELDATRVAVAESAAVGVVAGTAGTRVKLTDVVVRGTTLDAQRSFGHGVVVLDSATAEMRGTTLRDNADTGLVASHATATLASGAVAGNLVALRLLEGSTLREAPVDGAPAPLEVWVAPATVFEENVTRTETSTVPLPALLVP